MNFWLIMSQNLTWRIYVYFGILSKLYKYFFYSYKSYFFYSTQILNILMQNIKYSLLFVFKDKIFKKIVIFVVINFHIFSNFISIVEMLLNFVILDSFYLFNNFIFIVIIAILVLLFCLSLFHIFSIISIIKIVSLSWKNV